VTQPETPPPPPAGNQEGTQPGAPATAESAGAATATGTPAASPPEAGAATPPATPATAAGSGGATPPVPPGPGGGTPPSVGAGGSALAGGEVRVKLFARTDVGQVREHNEDNFLVADLTQRSRGLMEANRSAAVGSHGAVFAVCDGMGGAAAGEIASQLAVDIIYEKMVDGLDKVAKSSRDEIARRLVRAVEAAGLRIFQEAKLDRTRRGMGTTVTASALVDDHVFFAQVGDSRGYILRNQVLTQVTRDQSLVNQLIEAGQLTEEEAETFEHNNIILQALGTSDTVQVDLTYSELHRGDMLLLCSDGLSGMVRFDEIRDIMRSSQEPLEICKALTERANQAGGHDNITVIIVVFDGEGLPALSADTETLKYRKYILPEEQPENTEPFRRGGEDGTQAAALADTASVILGDPAGQAGGADTGAKPASARPSRSAASGAPGWHEHGPHHELDDRIEIPGTHVPAWVVVAIVVGVVALLAATAFFLLR
jgi:PPM family protein phosphatase